MPTNVAISCVGEVLDQAEVEERDLAVAVEQVVARMRVAVERVHAVQAAEHEAEEASPARSRSSCGHCEHLLPGGAGDQLGGQHPRRSRATASTSGTWMNGWPR